MIKTQCRLEYTIVLPLKCNDILSRRKCQCYTELSHNLMEKTLEVEIGSWNTINDSVMRLEERRTSAAIITLAEVWMQ